MIIGLDFDNTIIDYDQVFWDAGREQGLIPEHVPISKSAVRRHLRSHDREDDWTRLQGYVYGLKIRDARPFPGVRDFIRWCRQNNWETVVISLKTRRPVLGPAHDLRQAARNWLADHGFFDSAPAGSGLDPTKVFFLGSKADKLACIARKGCHYFLDDLPEFLAEPDFPRTTRPVLFDPLGQHGAQTCPSVSSWDAFRAWLEQHPDTDAGCLPSQNHGQAKGCDFDGN